MKPKICCSIAKLKEFSFEDYPFEGYELKIEEGIKPNIIILLKTKETFQGKDLSLHSQLSRIFSCVERGVPDFADAEMNILKSEIIISKIIGIKQIIFHMRESPLNKEEKKKFNEIIKFAEKNGIEMVYENHVCSEKVILNVLKTFPKLKFCLDIGHLNVAMHNKNFDMDLNKFLKKVKTKLVNIHAHNNYGEKDEHNSIEDGNLEWKKVLEKLKESNLKKIVIENRNKEDAIKTKEALERFYKIE
jgi:sugar phosphate isomerase/epimerase